MPKGVFIATERLKTLVYEIHKWTNQRFAEQFKIDEPRASRVLNSKEEPSKQLMREIHDYFKVEEPLFKFEPNAELVNGSQVVIKEPDEKQER